MKKILIAVALSAMTVMFSGCVMTKQVSYFQNLDSVDITQRVAVPEVKIKTNDELTILVSSITPEAAEPFNMNIGSRNMSSMSNTTAGRSMYSYIVDKDGNINFPVIGKINVLGLTRPQVGKTRRCNQALFLR